MIFSIIIPTYLRNDDLKKCLECLLPQVQGFQPEFYEIIVTDDSPNGTAQSLVHEFPFVQWVKGPGRGPAANRNHGAKQAKGEWLVFLDDDCIPSDGWLQAYVRNFIDTNEILEGKTVSERNQIRLNEEAPINEHGGNLWSCNFCIRAELFFEIGLFDEMFPFAAMEDTDFYVRLIQAKKKIVFVPEAIVVHPWRVIHPFAGGLQKRLNSQKFFLDKHLPKRTSKFRWVRIKILILSTCQDIYKLVQFKGRGFVYFFERLYFNLMMIFI